MKHNYLYGSEHNKKTEESKPPVNKRIETSYRKYQEVLEIARHYVATHGVPLVSLDAILIKANISSARFYQLFRSPEALIKTLFDNHYYDYGLSVSIRCYKHTEMSKVDAFLMCLKSYFGNKTNVALTYYAPLSIKQEMGQLFYYSIVELLNEQLDNGATENLAQYYTNEFVNSAAKSKEELCDFIEWFCGIENMLNQHNASYLNNDLTEK